MPAPQRIASLLSSATEILYGLGLGDRVVAVSHECDYPAEVQSKPRVTLSRIRSAAASGEIDIEVKQRLAAGDPLYEIDVDRLAALAPDLIVTQAQCDVCAVRYEDVLSMVRGRDAFRDTQVVALNPQSLGDIFSDILRVGAAVGCDAAAEAYVASLQSRVAAVTGRTMRLAEDERPRVACIEWTAPLMLAGNWGPEVIRAAGGVHALTVAGRHSPYVDWRRVRAYDPEIIVVAPCGFDLPRAVAEAACLKDLAGWPDVSAVRNGRVYAIDGNAYFNRAGPRMVETIEILAHLLHPALFEPPLTVAGGWHALSPRRA